MELKQFTAVIWKRLWLILLATALVAGMTLYLSVTSTPIYQATTTLEINPGGDPRTDPYSAVRTGEMVAGTYVEQIQAPVLLQEVTTRLGLPVSAEQLKEVISVEQLRDTQLIRISAESSDPALAQALADTIAQVFIEREMSQQEARFQAGLADLEAQIATVEASVERIQKAISSLGDPLDPENMAMPEFARLELARLNGQLTSDQTRLVILLRSAEDFRLAMARYTDYITVFSPAGLPTKPVQPRTMLNTVLGLISGLVLGVATAFLLEYLDDTIRSPEDAKQALPVGVLGVLPRLKETAGQMSLVVADYPHRPVSEAFRNLRTSIEFSHLDQPGGTPLEERVATPDEARAESGLFGLSSHLDQPPRTPPEEGVAPPDEPWAESGLFGLFSDLDQSAKRLLEERVAMPDEARAESVLSGLFSDLGQPARTLLVTSPLPTGGKTFTAANLAAVLAQGGKSVILVDADLRRPMLHRLFGLPREPGLTAALLAPGERSAVLQKTEVEGLRIITSGSPAPNPAELLASQTFQQFASWLAGQADVVVFESAPVLTVTDAVVLSNLTDGTLLVLDCGETRRAAAVQAVERLTSVGGKVLGVVLNRLAPSAEGYYYYHDYYYHSQGDGAAGEGKHSSWITRLLRPGHGKRDNVTREPGDKENGSEGEEVQT